MNEKCESELFTVLNARHMQGHYDRYLSLVPLEHVEKINTSKPALK